MHPCKTLSWTNCTYLQYKYCYFFLFMKGQFFKGLHKFTRSILEYFISSKVSSYELHILRYSIIYNRCFLKALMIYNVYTGNIDKAFNPFQVNVPFVYPPKMLENKRFSDVFRGYRIEALAWNGLRCSKLCKKISLVSQWILYIRDKVFKNGPSKIFTLSYIMYLRINHQQGQTFSFI